MKIVKPELTLTTAPKVAVFSAETQGGLRKYAEQFARHVKTPCVIVTAIDSPAFAAHWRAPILRYSTEPSYTPQARIRLLLRHLYNSIRLVDVAQQLKIQVIHIQIIEPLSLTLIWPLLRSRFKVVLSVHDVKPHEPYPYGLGKLQRNLLRKLYRQADALCVFSHYGASELANTMAVGTQKIHVMPLGCNEPLPLTPVRRIVRPRRPVFLLFGRYRANRGFEVLAEAFLQLRRSGYPGLLRIAGSYPKPFVSEVEDLYAAHGFLEDIEFINRFIAEEEIDGLMRSSDVLVLPYTDFESQSGILYLAYAYNLPVVASRIGGLAEMIETDRTGILVQPGDVESLVAGLSEIIKYWENYACTEAANLLHTKYSWERIGLLTDGLYMDLLVN